MDPERRQRVEELFHAALEREPPLRDAWLRETCGADDALRREVEELLTHAERAEEFLEAAAVDVAARHLATAQPDLLIGARIGPYAISSLIGEGGMGRVYQALDTQLNRIVAIKCLIADRLAHADQKNRFLREARAASALNHPNIVTIHALMDHEGMTFIVMEYVAGKTLDRLIPQNGMPEPQVIQYALEIGGALAVAHAAGIVHRDIKPSNIIVTGDDRIKVLDFGLAKLIQTAPEPDAATVTNTAEGLIFGTPAYMSPEQARGEGIDARSDLFSLGVVLYQMATGRLPFAGKNVVSILASILRDDPEDPGKTNSALAPEFREMILKLLAKDREARYASAAELCGGLRQLASGTISPVEPKARRREIIRLLPFPFRIDPGLSEVAHLSCSLPEAIGSSLAELEAFTVRSPQTAMRFDPVRWDLATVAAEADVDVILTGALTRGGGAIRAVTQLLDCASGAVVWSKRWDLNLDEVFEFVEGVAQLVIRALVRRDTLTDPPPAGIDRPANHEAYELYLRANQLVLKRTPENMALARDLYVASTQKDPDYAPAWALLGRCQRFLAKFGANPARDLAAAQEAFDRAFSLNPDLGIAHNLYTPLQVDTGGAQAAMVRLLQRAARRQSDPEIFSGLVHACRYCGQLDASLAAHERALRLDRNARTSVAHTFFLLGDYEKTLYWYGTGFGLYLDALALACLDREREAAALLWTRRDQFYLLAPAMTCLQAYLDGDFAAGLTALRQHPPSDWPEPEMRFYLARQAAKFGDTDMGNELLRLSVEEGYFSSVALDRDPWLESLRSTPEFARIREMAGARERQARAAFESAGVRL